MRQILAVVRVRARILINTLRRRASGWERVAAVFTLVLGALFAGGVAAGVAGLTWSLGSGADPARMRVGLLTCFWVCGLIGVVMPLVLSSGASGLDTSNLTSFPITRRKLFLLNWSSAFLSADHFAHYPTLLATFGVWLALGAPGGPAAGAVFWLLPVVVVTWSVGFLTLLQALMRHRRGKEIAGMVGFAVFLAFALAPSFLGTRLEREPEGVLVLGDGQEIAGPRSDGERLEELFGPALAPVVALAAVTPPNLAADAMSALQAGRRGDAARDAAGLVGWWVAGLLFAGWVFQRQLGSASARGRSGGGGSTGRRSRFDATRTFSFLPPEVVAVASKELRYIGRSSVGRLNVLIVPAVCTLMLMVFRPLVGADDFLGRGAEDWVLIGLMLYGLLFTNNFVSNAAGWEGVGFKSYLLAPVPFERVLFGKNLGVWIYSLLLFSLVLVTWVVFRGVPGLATLATAAAFYFGAVVLFTTAGNFASLAFPVARDISKMKSQPSQPAILMSLATVLGLAGLMLFLLGVPYLLGARLSPLVPMAAFLAAAALGYRVSLPFAANLFRRKRDEILARLEQAD